jgi:hypothetical protein
MVLRSNDLPKTARPGQKTIFKSYVQQGMDISGFVGIQKALVSDCFKISGVLWWRLFLR